MNFLMRAAVIAALLHITPVVVLVKRPDAVQTLLPGADAYVASEVHLSAKDAHRLHEGVDWSPEDGVLVFYGGTAGTTSVGALEFVRVDTPHGPIEVAVGFTPQGAVRGVVVTKATVEMKPWVLEAVAAGLTDHYRGLKPGGEAPGGAAGIASRAGNLAVYVAGEVDKGVAPGNGQPGGRPRYGHRDGRHLARRLALTDPVDRGHPEVIGGPVGQAGYGVAGGGDQGAVDRVAGLPARAGPLVDEVAADMRAAI